MSSRKLVIYIATSLDGYIARQDDDLSWLSIVETKGEDYGYQKFIATVDTIILGRRTYDKVLSMGVENPYGDKECYVITRTPQEPAGKIRFYSGDLTELVTKLKAEEGGTIFCDGGAQVISALRQHNLIDEYTISIIPILLGDGIRLSQDGLPEQQLQLVRSESYKSALVQLHYKNK
ncbi:dihydrofolate reductase family protein [Pontibacter cellulosilyticus]|uniref:Dihydrofolate reductase n=1 Tax=Pontibacter cellulosilyticus TaxID=1720253 RepID=A0A923SIR6_9BACT|nr:dihydrofolate reductase family protein [Pontibacter cellulosilyticus]MBC5992887.1 dihydrofolate reductase [Pontibacter cellulosilyticus]